MSPAITWLFTWCHLQGKLGTKINLLTNGLLLTSVVVHPLYLSVSYRWHWLLIIHLISVLSLTLIADHPLYLSVSYFWHQLLITHLTYHCLTSDTFCWSSTLSLSYLWHWLLIIDLISVLPLTRIVDLLVSCLWHRLLITHLTYQRLTSDTNCWSPTLLISVLPLTPIVDHPPYLSASYLWHRLMITHLQWLFLVLSGRWTAGKWWW